MGWSVLSHAWEGAHTEGGSGVIWEEKRGSRPAGGEPGAHPPKLPDSDIDL